VYYLNATLIRVDVEKDHKLLGKGGVEEDENENECEPSSAPPGGRR